MLALFLMCKLLLSKAFRRTRTDMDTLQRGRYSQALLTPGAGGKGSITEIVKRRVLRGS